MKKQTKSQKAIIAAFIEARKKQPVEKITVTGLCKKAEINKSTFYVYYKDIYDLCEKVEDALVERITTSIKNTELAFEHTDIFAEDVFKAYAANDHLISIIFSGSRSAMLPRKVHASLTKLLFKMRPEYANSPEKHIMFAYMIYGGFYAYAENKQYDPNYRISVISSLTKL